MLRNPAVLGQFYPDSPEKIRKIVQSFGLKKVTKKEKIFACLLPHAGYIYSGKVASSVLNASLIADTCIILGPNHTGYGVPQSIMCEGAWETPYGNVKINSELAQLILKNSKYLEDDARAHATEHSIEVQLPLIQEISKEDFTFVPIILASADDLVYKDIANAIYLSVRAFKKDVTIIASSDMTHYETQMSAAKKDKAAIEAILELNEKDLLEKIDKYSISMCGYMPAVVTIMASKLLGAKNAKLIAYETSGDVTKDYQAVVGYAGIVIQ